MTKEEAIRLYKSGFWESMTHIDRATFQLHEPLLCMPFGVFHEAVEKALGREVFTHEFARFDSLRAELRGERPAPTLEEIINLIPEDKRILVAVSDGPGAS